MRTAFAVLVASLLARGLAACAPASTLPAAAGPARERLAAETPKEMAGGTTFTAPAGWSYLERDGVAILETPEPDSRIAVVESTAADAEAAVAEAWRKYRPDFKRPLKLKTEYPGRDGWDLYVSLDYETSPNEKLYVGAVALRSGASWTVQLWELSDATGEKRGAQVGMFEESMRPAGYRRETFAGKAAHALDATRLAGIDAFIERARTELGIPGIGVAIAQGGRLVHLKGYGVRELGKEAPVDADTLFMIQSNGKALTTLLLALLVDDGKLRWDQPVVEVWPEFKLGDAATTASVQVQHLLCACTGLPRQDLESLFEYGEATPASQMKLLATFQPTTKFGETFQYSNLLAAAAGYTAAHVLYPTMELGRGYDEAMHTRVFAPLGMRTTTFDFALALRGNHATGHGSDIDGRTAVATTDIHREIIPLRPAGGEWSSARELIKYVQLELDGGKLPGGKQLVSRDNLLVRRAPKVRTGETSTYGMGLVVDTKWGIPVVDHGGGGPGYLSNMLFLPDHGVGAVILTNSDPWGYVLLDPFKRFLLEQLFDGKPEAEDDLRAAAKSWKERLAKERERLVIPADPVDVAKLGRRYVSPALGTIDVRAEGGQTIFDFKEWKSAVASRKNDDGTTSFVLMVPELFSSFPVLVVGVGEDGTRQLILRDAQHEYVFVEAR